MRTATPFHSDLFEYFEENAALAERELWIGGIILGAFACKVVYDTMKQYSPIYVECYSKLPKAKQVEWDNRGFSTAHAIFCSVVAGYLIFFSDVFRDDTPYGPVVFRSTILSFVTISFSTGYFLADLAMILWTYPSLGGPEYVSFLKPSTATWWEGPQNCEIVHHFLSIGSVVLANYSAHAHFYILMVLFSEVTTPFINFRWYLMNSGQKKSKYYVYNGVALLFVWLFARVVLFMYFFYHLYLHYDEVKELYAPGFYVMFTAPPVLFLMNLFWFYKIVAAAMRTLGRGKSE